MHIDSQRPNSTCRAAARTGGLYTGHFKGEDLLQETTDSIAIQFVFHHASPVGPKRSVLMRAGICPSTTRAVAAVSTNGVGPQTNMSGCCSGDQTTSCNS